MILTWPIQCCGIGLLGGPRFGMTDFDRRFLVETKCRAVRFISRWRFDGKVTRMHYAEKVINILMFCCWVLVQATNK